jgi:NAD(P)-dependent dehydrogenase (short-subunit alcohol dehydrogenase family)
MTNKKIFGPKGWTPEQLGSLAGKTYVITGATSGAGFEATRVFLSKGAKVVMMNRNANKSTAAIAALKQEFGSDADVTFVRIDLTVLDSVREAAVEVMEKVPHIDAFICNAGIAQVANRRSPLTALKASLV